MALEPSNHPIWPKLVKQLLPLITEPMTPKQVQNLARGRLGWSITVTSHVLAMAEGPELYFRNGLWQKYEFYRNTEEHDGRDERGGESSPGAPLEDS
jgi:hypothetical protein